MSLTFVVLKVVDGWVEEELEIQKKVSNYFSDLSKEFIIDMSHLKEVVFHFLYVSDNFSSLLPFFSEN